MLPYNHMYIYSIHTDPMANMIVSLSQMLHVWKIYLHLGHFWGKCKYSKHGASGYDYISLLSTSSRKNIIPIVKPMKLKYSHEHVP